jgi:hypothetical protein
MEDSHLRKRMPGSALFDPKIVVPAIGSAFVKLNPRTLIKESGHVRAGDRDHTHDGDLDSRPDHRGR